MGRFWENASALCAMFRTSYQTGQLCTNGDLENLSVGQVELSNRKLSIIRYLQKIRRRSTILARRFSQAFLWARPCTQGQIGKETYSLQTLSFYRKLKLQKYTSKDSAQKKFSCEKRRKIVFPCADGSLQLAWTGHGVRTSDPFRRDPEHGEEHRS